MRSVLLIAYHFPPLGGGGVQRAVRFARALGEFGYRVTVVTGTGASHDEWTPIDEGLGRDLGSEVVVHRVPGPEPPPSRGWRRRAERLLGRRSSFARWWIDGAYRAACDAGRDADIVLGELVPYETAEAAASAAAVLGKPWVADLQDPWAVDEMWLYPTAVQRGLDARRMRRVLSSAAAVVATAPEAARRIERLLSPAATPVVSIPNGYDARDFEQPVATRDDGRFRIVHAGYFHTSLARDQRSLRGTLRGRLGGFPVPGVDFLSRTPAYLAKAIRELGRRRPELAATVDLHVAGALTDADRAVLEALPNVTMHGYLSHDASVALVRSADLLFLPMHDLPPGRRAGLIPGKTFEYLASGNPILAAVPQGDARDLLAEAGGAVVLCPPSDADAIAAALERELRRWRSGAEALAPRRDVVARYEGRSLTRELAGVLDRVVVAPRRAEGPLEPAPSVGPTVVDSHAADARTETYSHG